MGAEGRTARGGAGGNVGVGGGGGGAPGRRRPPPPPCPGSSKQRPAPPPLLLLLLAALISSLLGTATAAESPSACYARCAAEALGAVFSSSAASSSSPPQQQQQQQHGPVCGSDGRSYANGCLASCAGATVSSRGYCEGDRLRFAGAGLPLLPASLLPFERGGGGEGEGRPSSSLARDGQQQRRNPTEALAERMALFAEEGFRYVGRTQLAPSVRRLRKRQPRESGGGGGSPAAASSSSAGATTTTTSVEVFRATPQGDLYVARYDVPQDEARRAGAAAAAALYRPADPNAAREAFLERRQQPSRAAADWPVVAAAALVPEIGNRGGGGEALERQLSALMAAPGAGNNGTTAAVVGGGASGDALLDGVKWPVVDVSACLKNETATAGGKDDFVPPPPPPPPPPASRRMLRSKNVAAATTSPKRTLSSILGPDERRRCPLSAEPALPEAVFARAMAEGRATLARGGTLGKPANLTTSSGSFTRGGEGGGGGGRNGDAGARVGGGNSNNKNSAATATALPPHAPPPAYGARWPYSALGQLETRDEAGERVCTGALVGPDTVLTAAHCVWDDATYAFVAAPDFSPGRYRDGCRLVSPWGVVKWKHATIFRAYADTWEQDVAIIKLDAPVGWRTAWLGMRASCGSADDGRGGNGGAGGAASSSSSSSSARQTHLSIAGYPLMPTRDGDGECLVAQCDVRLREPDAGTGQCPSDGGGGGGGASAALPTNPLTAHACDTAPGQSGAPLYDSEGYARAIHVLGISVGEPDNGATTLTPWVMANVARWVKGQQQGGQGGGGGVPEGEPMAAAGKGKPPAAAPAAGPVPDAIRSLMDTNGTLPLDKPEEWQKNFS